MKPRPLHDNRIIVALTRFGKPLISFIFSGVVGRNAFVLLLNLACSIPIIQTNAQTCCSGGVPLTNNVGGVTLRTGEKLAICHQF